MLHYTHTNTWLARPPCSAARCAAPRSREASAAAATCRFAATIPTCMPLLLPCLLLAAHMAMLYIAHARPAAAAAHEHAQHAPHTHTHHAHNCLRAPHPQSTPSIAIQRASQ